MTFVSLAYSIAFVSKYVIKLLFSFSKTLFLIFINTATDADINIDSTTNTAISSINVNPFLFFITYLRYIKKSIILILDTLDFIFPLEYSSKKIKSPIETFSSTRISIITL